MMEIYNFIEFHSISFHFLQPKPYFMIVNSERKNIYKIYNIIIKNCFHYGHILNSIFKIVSNIIIIIIIIIISILTVSLTCIVYVSTAKDRSFFLLSRVMTIV